MNPMVRIRSWWRDFWETFYLLENVLFYIYLCCFVKGKQRISILTTWLSIILAAWYFLRVFDVPPFSKGDLDDGEL